MNEEHALTLAQKDLQIVTRPSAQATFTLNGDNATQIGSVNTLNQVINIGANVADGQAPVFSPFLRLRTDFYHLFVIDGFDPHLPYFTVARNRALKKDMGSNAPERFSYLDDEAIQQLKDYPALFMDENEKADQPGLQQIAYLGYVAEIKNTSQICIYPRFCTEIQQFAIHAITQELQIARISYGGEMHRTHWALKAVDLHAVLYQAGLIGQDGVGRREGA